MFAALLLAAAGISPLRAACRGGISTSLRVIGAVDRPTVFSLRRFEQLPAAEENVTYFAGGSVATEAFIGALLWDLVSEPSVGGILVRANDIRNKPVAGFVAGRYVTIEVRAGK